MATEPPFTTAVEAGFAPDGVWVIRATLRYLDGVPPLGSRLLGEARLALLAKIAEAGIRGRRLGAETCRVHLDTEDGISEIALDDGWLPDLPSLN